MWLAGLPLPFAALWQVTQAVPATLAWLNAAADAAATGVADAADPAAVAARAALPEGARATGPVRVGAVVPAPPLAAVVVLPCRETAPRATNFVSREVWQPEPPQSWPA